MMRVLGLVLVLALALSCASFADVATKTVYPGWNLVSTPLALYDTSTGLTFANVTAQWPLGRNCVYGWDPATGAKTFVPQSPAAFGGVLIGQGYLLKVATQTTVTFTGFPSGLPDGGGVKTDFWLSLPGGTDGGGNPVGSWHYIGQPFNHNTVCTAVLFTDGITVRTWLDACTVEPLWVADRAYGFGQTGGFYCSPKFRVGQPNLVAGNGYQLQTKKGNIAMIIPASPVAP